MRIRLASELDLEPAAQLWFDRIALLREFDPCIVLAANAVGEWRKRAQKWILDSGCAFFVAETEGELAGFMVVRIMESQPGLSPEKIGTIVDLAVDLHQSHRGMSAALLERAKAWLRLHGVGVLEIQTPAHYPVEETFWRGQGAKLRQRKYWLNL